MSRAPLSLAALLLLASGCLSLGPDANSNTLPFSFLDASASWSFEVSDFPIARTAEVAANGELRPLPVSLGVAGNAQYESGNNVSGDLFLFHKAYRSGLTPLKTYHVSLQATYATNYHAGCSTGPGPHVVLKAGVLPTEPIATPNAQGVWQMNINKGAGTEHGDFVNLGDIRNGLSGCPATGTYALRTTDRIRQSGDITTDQDGGFWMFVATQSTALGSYEIFITELSVKISY